MALTADVHPGDVIASPWGNEIRNRSLQAFASTAERDAQWPTAPNGSICLVVTGTDAVMYHRRAGAWAALHVTAVLVDGAATVNGAATVAAALTVNQPGGSGVVGIQAQAIIATNWQLSANKNSVDKSWANAQVLSQGDTGNGARLSLFNPSVGGQQLGVFGGGASGALYLLDHNGTTRGTINFTATSSARFKQNIRDHDVDVDALAALRVRAFERIHGPNVDGTTPPPTPEIGLVVEETRDVWPDLVVDHPGVDVETIDTPRLLFSLLGAVQGLLDRVAALELAR